MSVPSSPDSSVLQDQWSDLSRYRELPHIDSEALNKYRLQRLRAEMNKADVATLMLVSPISLRYAIEYRCYAQFQLHIPTSYAFISLDGPVVLYNAYDPAGGLAGNSLYEVRQEQVLVTENGPKVMTNYPFEAALLD